MRPSSNGRIPVLQTENVGPSPTGRIFLCLWGRGVALVNILTLEGLSPTVKRMDYFPSESVTVGSNPTGLILFVPWEREWQRI